MTGGIVTTRGKTTARNKTWKTAIVTATEPVPLQTEFTSAPIIMDGSASCVLYVAAGDLTLVNLYARVGGTENYYPVRDTTGAAISIPITAQEMVLIDEGVYPFDRIMFVSDDSATGCRVMLSS